MNVNECTRKETIEGELRCHIDRCMKEGVLTIKWEA